LLRGQLAVGANLALSHLLDNLYRDEFGQKRVLQELCTLEVDVRFYNEECLGEPESKQCVIRHFHTNMVINIDVVEDQAEVREAVRSGALFSQT
jgi:hypothetical protein